MTAPPQDLEAEQAVLGSILLGGSPVLGAVALDEGLRSAHFYRDAHGTIYAAMLRLHDAGEPVDTLTLRDALTGAGMLEAAGGRAALDVLGSHTPDAGNYRRYAAIVREKADLRRKRDGAQTILEGVATEDRDKIDRGEAMLANREALAGVKFSPQKLAEMFRAGDAAPVLCPWPWQRLNTLTAGGMRAAQTTFLGGWTSHGKSAAADQIAIHARKYLPKVGLYLNEMSPAERMMRIGAHTSSVDLTRITESHIDVRERESAAAGIERSSPHITDASGWTGDEICRDITRSGWPLAVVDILHEIDYEDEGDLRRIGSALNRCAKRTGCHIIATVHLNEERNKGLNPPQPVLRDIRGSGMLKNSADFVLFVWQQTDEDGHPKSGDARIYLSKARTGKLGGLKARFRGDVQRFEPA